jgi:two-component SAPR family response regulator
MAPDDLKEVRVLVVEDEYLTAIDVCDALERAGAIAVGPISYVADAMSLLESVGPIDAAVLDINLHGEMVYPLAEALQQIDVPIVFTTAYDRGSLPHRYRSARICTKPVEPGQLVEAIRLELNSHLNAHPRENNLQGDRPADIMPG